MCDFFLGKWSGGREKPYKYDLSTLCTLLPRLRRIVTCIRPNQKNQPNLDLYLVRRYKICHFPIVVLYLCIGQNLKNQPNVVMHLVRRSKIFVSAQPCLLHIWHACDSYEVYSPSKIRYSELQRQRLGIKEREGHADRDVIMNKYPKKIELLNLCWL